MNQSQLGIVVDGAMRLREAIRQQAVADATQRYADQRKNATGWQRFWLDQKIRREINLIVKKTSSTQSLF
jgi:hypothetical protein